MFKPPRRFVNTKSKKNLKLKLPPYVSPYLVRVGILYHVSGNSFELDYIGVDKVADICIIEDITTTLLEKTL